jgi:hypothetical protein
MSASITVLLVDKNGSLKSLSIKDFKEEELYKKCGFKVATHFGKQHTWVTKIEGSRYNVSVYGKTDGKANTENKYDFPPPLDNVLLFGTCVIVGTKVVDVSSEAAVKEASSKDFVFTVELWNKIYEKLFGGFEDLNATAAEDDEEEDELEMIPVDKKTKQGYLKDGFVVDSEEDEEEDEYESDFDEEDEDGSDQEDDNDNDDLPELVDIGSELSEEPYI